MSAKYKGDPNVLQILKKASTETLLQLLDTITGEKDLVLDKEIICSLDYIANFTLLKACKVEKIFKLEPGSSPGQTKKCVYMIRPKIQNAKIIADHINANLSVGNEKEYWLIYVPRKLYVSEKVLEREGVYGYISQIEFPLGFVALEKDLLSLEINDFYKSFFLKGDLAYIHSAAIALVQLFRICGHIPKIFGQGRCAKMVIDLMTQLMDGEEFPEIYPDKISHLVILDRDIDYTSVLLSQLTYEGLLDETFGINNGRIVFPKEVTGKDEPLKVVLHNSGEVYEEIRNSHFASVFGFFGDKAKELQTKADTRKMSLSAVREFVDKELKNINQNKASLSLHIGASEVIMRQKNEENFQERLRIEREIIENQNIKESINYIEDIINKQDPYTSALRLMCLLSVAQDGLLSSDYKSLATQFLQSHGSKYLITLHNLKKTGLLIEQASLLPSSVNKIEKVTSMRASKIAEKVVTAVNFPRYSSFKTISKKFNLILDEKDTPDLKNPKDMSYIFGGTYVPLVGRITEQVIADDSLKNIEEGMKLLPGSTIMNIKTDKDTGHVNPLKFSKSKTVLVYVLGGITYSEVAALRLLEKLYDVRIFIATTSFISGNSLMQMLSPPAT